jgi:nickel-dependent lactate racemase
VRLPYQYPGIQALTVPDRNLVGHLAPKVTPTAPQDAESVVRQALGNPIGSPPLRECLKPGDRVLVLVDDYTRSTPAGLILPILIEELRKAGIDEPSVSLLVASGTHRPMTAKEKAEKYGTAVVRAFKVYDHQWHDPRQLRRLPDTSGGTEVWINRLLLETDLVVGIGHIVPHRVAGFSGGGKIVQPGVCGEKTTGQTHWMSALYQGEEIIGKIQNPVRSEINRVAEAAGLRFLVNVVQDGQGRIVACFCGHPVAAFEQGCRSSLEIFAVPLEQRADIVITDSYPADMDLWQASRGIYAADLALNPGGTVILVTPCPEGISAEQPELASIGYLSFSQIEEMVVGGRIGSLTLAAHIAHVGRVIRDKGRCFLVSPGIPRHVAEHMGFSWFESPALALRRALELHGRRASVVTMSHGGELMPTRG